MISLRQLRYLDALARHGHFGRAADAAAVTQPALSMQIKALEETLGLPLVERSPKGARLTADGEAVLARGRAILADVAALQELAEARAGLLKGTLRLGVIPSIAPYLLPGLLKRLKQDHPDLALAISETQTERLIAHLAEGALDLLLLALPIDAPGAETLPLFEDPFLLAAPPETEGGEALKILGDSRVLLLEDGHCLRDQAVAFCRDRQAGAVDPFGASTLTTLLQLVAAGEGVTLLPEMAAAAEGDRVRLIRFPKPEPARTVGLAWRAGSPKAADYRAFGDLLLSATSPQTSSDR